MNGCHAFRRRLEGRLAGKPEPADLARLGWHEHLLACTSCRDLLEAEEALEVLLASLPEPQLAPDVAERVLSRLRAARDVAVREGDALDALLDLEEVSDAEGLAQRMVQGVKRERVLENLLEIAGEVEVPEGLAARIQSGCRGEREEVVLDSLLELAGDVSIPAGLAQRVQAGLESSRAAEARSRFALLSSLGVRRAAAAILLSFGLFALWRSTAPPGASGTPVAVAEDELSDEFLAALSALQYMETLSEDEGSSANLLAAGDLDAGDLLILELTDRLDVTEETGR